LKKTVFFFACVLGFLFIAAPIFMQYETRAVVSNGKPFANAQFVNNQWAIPIGDFAKAFGGTLTLEPNFRLQGNTLVALMSNYAAANKKFDAASSLPAVQKKADGAIILQNKGFQVRKAGEVSHNVFTVNGTTFVPLADVAKAFGTTFTAPAGNLAPGQALTLNFSLNGNGVLGFN
jgi:hypothetical protein